MTSAVYLVVSLGAGVATVCFQDWALLTCGAQHLCGKLRSGWFSLLFRPQLVVPESLADYHLSSCATGDRTQDLTHVKRVLYPQATPTESSLKHSCLLPLSRAN